MDTLSKALELLEDYASLLETFAADFPEHAEELENVNTFLDEAHKVTVLTTVREI